jgi:two-component system NarL family sensor kinase
MLQVGRQSNIKITCRCDVEMDRPEAELATAIFRIAQEALTNIQKHSYSNRAWVKLWQDGDDLYLLVRDFGCGFDLQKDGAGSQGDQLGLLGIQERVELLGGSLFSAVVAQSRHANFCPIAAARSGRRSIRKHRPIGPIQEMPAAANPSLPI